MHYYMHGRLSETPLQETPLQETPYWLRKQGRAELIGRPTSTHYHMHGRLSETPRTGDAVLVKKTGAGELIGRPVTFGLSA